MAIDFGLGLRALQTFGEEAARSQDMEAQRQQMATRGYAFDQQRQQDAGRRLAGGLAANGDFAGAQRLATQQGDFDATEAFGKLDAQHHVQALGELDTIGQLAESLKSLPAEARGAAAAPILQRLGLDGHDIDYSDAGLDRYYAMTKQGQAVIAAQAKNATEAYTLNAGDRRYVGDKLVAENPKPNNPDYIFDSESGSWLLKPGTGTGPAGIAQPGYASAGGATAPATGGAPRSVRNNNPGNIIDSPFARSQPGYKGSDGRFAMFDSPDAGAGAQAALLGSYIDRGFNTVEKIINRWAPPSENDTGAYVRSVAKALNVNPGDTLSKASIPALQRIISRVEGGPGGSSAGTPAPAAGQPGVINVRPGKTKNSNAPSGYRFNGDRLEPIPGGPADPNTSTQRNVQSNRTAEANFRKEFDGLPEVKTFKTARQQFNTLRDLGTKKNPTAADDIALIFNYMKVLDPGSVVREGEFATAQNAGGIDDNIRNAYNKAISGTRLNPDQRRNMVRTAYTNYKNYRDAYNQTAENYRGYARDNGIQPDRVARTYTPDKPAPKPASSRMSQFKIVKVN